LAGCGSSDGAPELVDASVSPDGRFIAYAARASGDLDLYVAAAAGGRPRLVAGSERSERSPVWSPDGTRLAYVVEYEEASRGELWAVHTDGRGRARLFDRPARSAAWSPDGRRLVFVAKHEDDADLDSPGGTLHVVEADGTRAHPVAAERRGDTPTWSPDGRSLAFWSGRVVDDSTDRGDVYTVNVGSGRVKRLTRRGDVDRYALRWVPRGREILYTREPDLLDEVVETVDARTGRSRRLRGPALLWGRPALSPDGRWIVYDDVDRVTAWRLDGSTRRVLHRNGTFGPKAWSPDGRMLAVETFAAVYEPVPTDVLVLGVDGSRPRNLTRTRGSSESLVGWLAGGRVAVVRDERSLWVFDVHGRGRLAARAGDDR